MLKEAWEGPARLELVSHANAPVATLPVNKILGGKHIKADLTLPYGKVVYDYIKEAGGLDKAKEIAGKVNDYTSLDFSKEEDVLKSPAMPLSAPSY